jgi:hypothetical protein
MTMLLPSTYPKTQQIKDRRLESVAKFVLGAAEASVGNFGRSLTDLAPLLDGDVPAPDFVGPDAALIAQAEWSRLSGGRP